MKLRRINKKKIIIQPKNQQQLATENLCQLSNIIDIAQQEDASTFLQSFQKETFLKFLKKSSLNKCREIKMFKDDQIKQNYSLEIKNTINYLSPAKRKDQEKRQKYKNVLKSSRVFVGSKMMMMKQHKISPRRKRSSSFQLKNSLANYNSKVPKNALDEIDETQSHNKQCFNQFSRTYSKTIDAKTAEEGKNKHFVIKNYKRTVQTIRKTLENIV